MSQILQVTVIYDIDNELNVIVTVLNSWVIYSAIYSVWYIKKDIMIILLSIYWLYEGGSLSEDISELSKEVLSKHLLRCFM
jgi:hypothetical protein